VTPLAIVACLAVVAIAIGRVQRARARRPPNVADRARARVDALVRDDPVVHRLERLRYSIDAIAIEVQRIGESQRSLTARLADARQTLLEAKELEP
jgi:hypothetical protein